MSFDDVMFNIACSLFMTTLALHDPPLLNQTKTLNSQTSTSGHYHANVYISKATRTMAQVFKTHQRKIIGAAVGIGTYSCVLTQMSLASLHTMKYELLANLSFFHSCIILLQPIKYSSRLLHRRTLLLWRGLADAPDRHCNDTREEGSDSW